MHRDLPCHRRVVLYVQAAPRSLRGGTALFPLDADESERRVRRKFRRGFRWNTERPEVHEGQRELRQFRCGVREVRGLIR